MPSKKTLIKREWLRRNKHHRLARTAVKNALQRGKIRKTECRVCNQRCVKLEKSIGNSAWPVEAHHNSYYPSKRLVIEWLCKKHHLAWHRLFVPIYPPAKYGSRIKKDLRRNKTV